MGRKAFLKWVQERMGRLKLVSVEGGHSFKEYGTQGSGEMGSQLEGEGGPREGYMAACVCVGAGGDHPVERKTLMLWEEERALLEPSA